MLQTSNAQYSFSPSAVTARILKGGALLPDMRAVVSLWEDGMEKNDPLPAIARALPKATMSRVKDTYTCAFRPRFLQGYFPFRETRRSHKKQRMHLILNLFSPIFLEEMGFSSTGNVKNSS